MEFEENEKQLALNDIETIQNGDVKEIEYELGTSKVILQQDAFIGNSISLSKCYSFDELGIKALNQKILNESKKNDPFTSLIGFYRKKKKSSESEKVTLFFLGVYPIVPLKIGGELATRKQDLEFDSSCVIAEQINLLNKETLSKFIAGEIDFWEVKLKINNQHISHFKLTTFTAEGSSVFPEVIYSIDHGLAELNHNLKSIINAKEDFSCLIGISDKTDTNSVLTQFLMVNIEIVEKEDPIHGEERTSSYKDKMATKFVVYFDDFSKEEHLIDNNF